MIQWLLIILGWVAVPVTHRLLLRWIPYRWVVNSIIYPYTKARLKRRYEIMSKDERIESWTNFHISDHWSKGFWFTERLEKYILLNYLDDENSPTN